VSRVYSVWARYRRRRLGRCGWGGALGAVHHFLLGDQVGRELDEAEQRVDAGGPRGQHSVGVLGRSKVHDPRRPVNATIYRLVHNQPRERRLRLLPTATIFSATHLHTQSNRQRRARTRTLTDRQTDTHLVGEAEELREARQGDPRIVLGNDADVLRTLDGFSGRVCACAACACGRTCSTTRVRSVVQRVSGTALWASAGLCTTSSLNVASK
jgi:hypothetical protein